MHIYRVINIALFEPATQLRSLDTLKVLRVLIIKLDRVETIELKKYMYMIYSFKS